MNPGWWTDFSWTGWIELKIPWEGIYPESFLIDGFLVRTNFTIKTWKWWSIKHVWPINMSHSTWKDAIRHPPKRNEKPGLKNKAVANVDPSLKCIMNHILTKTTRQALKASIKPHIIQSYRCPSNFTKQDLVVGTWGQKDEATKFHPPPKTIEGEP